MKICSVVPLLGLKPACSFLSFDSTPIRILLITIFPMTLLTTDSSVIPRQFLHSFRFPFLGSFTISPFLHFSGVVFSLHTTSMISLTLVVASSMSALSSSAFMLSIPGAFPFFRCPMPSSLRLCWVQMYQFLLLHPTVLSLFRLLHC